MSLTNAQYDSLMREYETTRTRNGNLLRSRTEEVYRLIPEYAELDSSVGRLGAMRARAVIDGDDAQVIRFKAEAVAIKEKKALLLKEAGFPSDYLEPVYSCQNCRDTGYAEGTKCFCLKRRETDLLYQQSNIKAILSQENFSKLSYDFYSGQDLINFKSAVEGCRSFISEFSQNNKNMLFYGSVGVGKTFLTNCVAREILERGYFVLYFSASALIDVLSSGQQNTKFSGNLYNPRQDVYNCDLLIIDDLGTEFVNSYVVSQLFSCLNERQLRHRSTIISTNLSLKDIRDNYTERIFSRLSRNYNIYKVTGPDIRLLVKTGSVRK